MSPRVQDAWLCGLEYAELIRAHFPDFFAEHLGSRPLIFSQLHALASVFLSLAHAKLVNLDLENIPHHLQIYPTKPLEAYRYVHPPSSQESLMGLVGRRWLDVPRLRVYGFDDELVVSREWNGQRSLVKEGVLALLCWRLVSQSPWQVVSSAHTLEICDLAGPLQGVASVVRECPPLAPDVALLRLCRHLDEAQPLQIRSLGALLAYTCRRLSNPFATVRVQEQRDAPHALIPVRWSWPAATFTALRWDQRSAQQGRVAYQRLARRCAADPRLLLAVSEAISSAAAECLGGTLPDEHYSPGALIDLIEGAPS